ncbi:hypothetical protein BaRGS_00006857, partial [Batillaria attramentaria]
MGDLPNEKEEDRLRKEDYSRMLQFTDVKTKKSRFMRELNNNITKGRTGKKYALDQLDLLEDQGKTDLLGNYPEKDLNCMQLAAFFQDDAEIIKKLAELHPDLIWKQRKGEYDGQTVLHLLIVKQNLAAAEAVLKHAKSFAGRFRGNRHGGIWQLMHGKATGSRFKSTVMMGGLPLSVAALTFNEGMVKLLIRHGAEIFRRNAAGDTVFHTLVLYSAVYPEKQQKVKDMMLKLHQLLVQGLPTKTSATTTQATKPKGAEARDVWLMENNEGLTPLRLAAAHGQPDLFKVILNLEGVYRHLDDNDGLFDSSKYDVTEIDPVAFRLCLDSTKDDSDRVIGANVILYDDTMNREVVDTRKMVRFQPSKLRDMSVMEIVCETDRGKVECAVINTGVVREMIKRKWFKYRPRFWIWAVLHVLFMILITTHAVYKAGLISDDLRGQPPGDTEKAFVTAVAVMCLGVPVVIVPMEMMLLVPPKQPLNPELRHHNGLYRILLFVFSISVAVDSIWFLAAGADNNYFLILALLAGWWFTSFFLRPFKKFSFYTVMLQKVVFGDMLRFSTILLLEWLAFSVGMHVAYLATPEPGPPPEFKDLGVSMLTMFKLMFGLTEIDLLYGSRNEWLVITLFILFTLLTYVLMLNALIAMMSTTCTNVSENKVRQWELQRLSVVLMLESMMPFERMNHNCGEKEE